MVGSGSVVVGGGVVDVVLDSVDDGAGAVVVVDVVVVGPVMP